MKKLFFSLVAMMLAAVSFAQSTMVATLNHNGEVNAYFGASAFKSAMANAVDGDAITLSSGRFDATDITKAVSIRGAGVTTSEDSLNAHGQTFIYGTTHISIADSTSESTLFVEGLYFNDPIEYGGTLKNARFQKCRLPSLNYMNDLAEIVDISFLNCRICKSLMINGNAIFINSIVCDPCGRTFEFINSHVKFLTNYYINQIKNSFYTNCIIETFPVGENYNIPVSSVAYNCLAIAYGNHYSIFENMPSNNTSNKSVYETEMEAIFRTYIGEYNRIDDSDFFELTDSAVAVYLGTDGTQVGIYGGSFPYNENPNTLKITKLTVSPKTDVDNKLLINLGVKATE